MLIFLSAFVLGGCAFSPGLYMGSATSQSGAAVPDAALSKVLQPHADALKTAGSDAPPSGVLTPITAELVRQLHQQSQADESARIRHLFGTPRPYAIGPGDLLHIVVWEHPEINLPVDAVTESGGYNVSSKGMIQFPYIGNIKVSGLTEEEARAVITRAL